MFFPNPMTLCDGYKLGHRNQYPEGTTKVYSNLTPRGSRVPDADGMVFFGLRYFLKQYLDQDFGLFADFFDEDEDVAVEKFKRRVDGYLGPDNNVGTEHVRALHRLGYLPLRISALREGTLCPLRVPAMVFENTNPALSDAFFWLTNYIETMLSAAVWGPSTSATTARRFRKIVNRWARVTGSPLAGRGCPPRSLRQR